MLTLERALEEVGPLLRKMPAEKTRRLEVSLRRLSPDNTAFAQETLERAVAEECSPVGRLDLLALRSAFEDWPALGLATKLAALVCITILSQLRSWPDDTAEDIAVYDICKEACSALVSAHGEV